MGILALCCRSQRSDYIVDRMPSKSNQEKIYQPQNLSIQKEQDQWLDIRKGSIYIRRKNKESLKLFKYRDSQDSDDIMSKSTMLRSEIRSEE